jgi:hypothetical protein
MLLGIGLMGVVTATLASYFITQQRNEKLPVVEESLQTVETFLEAQSTVLGAWASNAVKDAP